MAGLTLLRAGGSARAFGLALGRFGRPAVPALVATSAWKTVTVQAESAFVQGMAQQVRATFPAIWDEISGLAEGLGLPLAEVFAWNCRGDIWAAAPDGCTTVMMPGPPHVLAHNEDGLPVLAPHCGLVEARPGNGPDFVSFVYPGSIPGHAFAVNAAGLTITVNNIRPAGAGDGLPRMVLGRALLGVERIGQAVAMMRRLPRAGGFHFALAQAGEDRLISLEFCGKDVSARDISVPEAHANHMIHEAMRGLEQTITESSGCRQARADALLGADPLEILRDRAGPGLPILRLAEDDPDTENTIATAQFEVGEAVTGTVHLPGQPAPAYRMTADRRARTVTLAAADPL